MNKAPDIRLEPLLAGRIRDIRSAPYIATLSSTSYCLELCLELSQLPKCCTRAACVRGGGRWEDRGAPLRSWRRASLVTAAPMPPGGSAKAGNSPVIGAGGGADGDDGVQEGGWMHNPHGSVSYVLGYVFSFSTAVHEINPESGNPCNPGSVERVSNNKQTHT